MTDLGSTTEDPFAILKATSRCKDAIRKVVNVFNFA